MASNSTNNNIYSNKLKRTIKTGMHALKMDDATYRDMLERVTMRVSGKAKNSIKNMSINELNAVVEEMRKKGFEPKRGKNKSGKDNSPRNENQRPMIGKVQALWITMHQQGFIKDGSDNALNAFVRKRFNPHRQKDKKPLIINLFGTTDYELWQLIETLKSWQQREEDKQILAQMKAEQAQTKTKQQ